MQGVCLADAVRIRIAAPARQMPYKTKSSVTATPSALGFDHVSMEFPGVKALDDVSFDVRAGSIHALMGENGAGKSTLLKILSGAYTPSGGALVIDGQRKIFTDTAAASLRGSR